MKARMMWWRKLRTLQKIVLVTFVVCIIGLCGSLYWDYPGWPFVVVGFAAVVTNGVMFVRSGGYNAPVEGRKDLSTPRD